MKAHHIIISASIFVLCWLIFGFRGVDAGVVGIATFILGVRVGHKEEESAAFLGSVKDKFVKWFN